MIDNVYNVSVEQAKYLPRLCEVLGSSHTPVWVERIYTDVPEGRVILRSIDLDITINVPEHQEFYMVLGPEDIDSPVFQAELTCALADIGVEF